LGCKIDRHFIAGQGNIGEQALKRFASHPALRTIPCILELPVLSEEQEIAILNMVIFWDMQTLKNKKEKKQCVLQ
jgi:endonuclease IV